MLSRRFDCFVTGTDTGVGKTLVASALLRKCRAHGWSALGMKPVAAGGYASSGEWRNDDVEALIAEGCVDAPRGLINPYLFREAVAPHIGAANAGVSIEPARILDCFRQLSGMAEAVVVEGAGGFLVPLGDRLDSGDIAQMLGLPVVLVVGMRLGCINHALLTRQAIVTRGLELAGWVANRIDPAMARFEENLAALDERLGAPRLGVLPRLDPPSVGAAAACVDLSARGL